MNAADPSVKELAERLASSDPDQRAAAAEGLAQSGPECRSACIELVRACGTDDATREWATAALEEMGSPPPEMVGLLAPLLGDDSADVAYWAATLLGRLEGQADSACDALADVIVSSRDLFVRERAVWAAVKIGCSSPSLVQSLNAARDCEHERLSRLAKEALDAI